MESQAVSAHGTLLYRNGVLIPELVDIRPPQLSRDLHEVTRIGDEDDDYKTGIRKSSQLEFTLNLLFDDPEHIGLLDAWRDAEVDEWQLHFADGNLWTFEGFVVGFAPANPVDGAQTVQVTVRPTDHITFGATLAQEDGFEILLEDGGSILV